MLKYTLKRLFLSIFILIGVSIIIYALVRWMPNDYVDNKFASQVAQGTLKQEDIDNIDTASIMSKYGHKIYVTEGPTENIKITTPLDFYTFKAIYEARKEGRG